MKIVEENKINIINWLIEIKVINKFSDLLLSYFKYIKKSKIVSNYQIIDPNKHENIKLINILTNIGNNLINNKCIKLFELFISSFNEINKSSETYHSVLEIVTKNYSKR